LLDFFPKNQFLIPCLILKDVRGVEHKWGGGIEKILKLNRARSFGIKFLCIKTYGGSGGKSKNLL
jgi:hypothetical protein